MRNELEVWPQLVVLGVPGSRRVALFVEAARKIGIERIFVTSYLDCLAGSGLYPPMSDTLMRLESPCECAATTRAILSLGIGPLEAAGGKPLSQRAIDDLAFERGEMIAPRQWYLGYCELLRRIAPHGPLDNLRWMSTPAAVLTTFDKIGCLEQWQALALPVPRRFPGIQSYGQLRAAVREPHARLFVKLRYGYSALGAVALEWRGPLVRAITTMEVEWSAGRPRLFLSKRPRVLASEAEIAWLIDTLAAEEILVEEWLPKARWQGLPYDLRVLTIGGRMRHVVGRANASPFTNLNLDARRIPREVLEERLEDAWEELERLCKEACAPFAGAGSLALDVLVRPGERKFALLEVNAFGDYLPGLLHDGQSTYEAELQAVSSVRMEACA